MTRNEARGIRAALGSFIVKIADSPAEINENPAAIRIWKPDPFVAGDIRAYEGIPYKCVQAHDSTGNEAWNPAATPALWMQYHGTSKASARPWVAPTGAHDMYRAGEWMIWTDGQTYRCVQDTVYSPGAYPAGWELV